MTVEPPKNSIHPKTRSAWRTWLTQNHDLGEGIWLISWKKISGKPQIPYDDLVQEALCFGWIDSKPNKLDEQRSMLWFAPRKSGSGWSRLNKERIEHAIITGIMMPSGLAKVEAAKKQGSWNALDAVVPLFFDGKSDGTAVFPVKSKLSNAIHHSSISSKINRSLTIEWERRTCVPPHPVSESAP
jgi:hypothetical protein